MSIRSTPVPSVQNWSMSGLQLWFDAFDYGVDAAQRSFLVLDALRKRGNQHMERRSAQAPHVLVFDFDLIMDGRELDRPVNYALVRIKPPRDVVIDASNRPFIIVDPRAGHGPGIGGFKPDSEIGMAMRAGHPCYFIGFIPEPMPGQTINDVCHAQAVFVAEVATRHGEADGKPVVIGNCQAGWQTIGTAAVRPGLMGPIILAGSPLSYWSGIDEKNPMGYLGGLLGGTWLSTLWGDLGNGKFDGAWLVNNFEQLNPSNTYWSKLYNLYSRIDTEEQRFLEFEKWWTTFYLLNTEEISAITNELFVGNRLTSGELVSRDGQTIDLRKIQSPIVCFCSWGDNITPPQQALHWITDLYESVEEIRAHGQTIVYALHDTTGHLGIFVSGSVARKEHREFTNNIDLIDALPPGLYQAVMIEKTAAGDGAELASGDYVLRFEARDIEDIRAIGEPNGEDLKRFQTVAKVSDVNEALYRTFGSPVVQAMSNEQSAEFLRTIHPQRLPNQLLCDQNPFMSVVKYGAEMSRANRHPIRSDNLFAVMQGMFSDQMVSMLDAYRDRRDVFHQQLFNAIYQSPFVQACVGMTPSDDPQKRRQPNSEAFDALVAQRYEKELLDIAKGGPVEAVIRSLLYVAMAARAVDERSFRSLELINNELPDERRVSMSDFKAIVRKQFTILLLDTDRAMAALPSLYSDDPVIRKRLFEIVRMVVDAQGSVCKDQRQRLDEIATLIDLGSSDDDRGANEVVAAA